MICGFAKGKLWQTGERDFGLKNTGRTCVLDQDERALISPELESRLKQSVRPVGDGTVKMPSETSSGVIRTTSWSSLDLLRKSWSGKHGVIDSGQQIEAEVESAPTMTIDARQTPEDFEAAYHVFHGQAFARQRPIFSLLLDGQGMLFGCFAGGARTRVFAPETLVRRIGEHFSLWVNRGF